MLWATFYVFASIGLYLAIWLLWLTRSKHILFVYSDSPKWRDYIEREILTVICEQAVVLNWSRRRSYSWRILLAITACRHFGGRRDFSPMAVVFRPLRRARVFRFRLPFRDFKHGKPEALFALQREFFDYSHADAIRPEA